jgi:hypothetical protein
LFYVFELIIATGRQNCFCKFILLLFENEKYQHLTLEYGKVGSTGTAEVLLAVAPQASSPHTNKREEKNHQHSKVYREIIDVYILVPPIN